MKYTLLLFMLCITGGVMAQPLTPSNDNSDAKNVLGEPLQPCCFDPLTGFFRDGSCRTSEQDHGTHVVCAKVDETFLDFTRARGNDLSTPRPMHQFPGLKPGYKWCLCALRWKEAYEAGKAPPLVLESTHEKALEFIPLDILQQYAVK